MPMLLWLPMIVMAGFYRSMSDDMTAWQRACIGASDRDEV